MLVEDAPTSPVAMSKKYSSCPLKKRPVTLVREAPERAHAPPTPPTPTLPCSTLIYYDDVDENDEPENLSTKPEDLSRTGNYPSKATSPGATATSAQPPAPLRAWEPRCRSPAPLAPPPQYLCTTKLEPLNLHADPTPVHTAPTWHTPCPQYAPYLPLYSGEGFVPYGSALHAAVADRYSPYAQRGVSRSPPERRSPYSPPPSPHSASSYCSPPPPEDLTSPGSVSSDSGISASSVPGKRRRDSAAPRYQCPDCAKSYSTYSGLSKHQQYHCAAAEGSLAKKSFSCKYCAKVYTSLGALKMHIRTHTLPCKCHLCGKAFSRPWLLQGHIRTHTGEKPFSCHHCRRAFADRSNLRAHLQTHSEVKKYSCGACSKTFSRMSLLSKHMEGGCGAPAPHTHLPPLHPALHYDYRPDELPAY